KVLDMYINYPVVVKEITAPCVVHEEKDFIIRAFPLNHTKVCVGYTLEEKDRPGEFNPEKAKELNVPCGPLWSKLQNGETVEASDGTLVKPEDILGKPRKGRKFSYVTDTAYMDSIAQEVKNSDLLVCEGMFERALIDQAKEKKHMTSSQAAMIARDSNSKKMCLIHYSPRYTDKELGILEEEAKEIYPGTILSKDRMRFEIPFED
ncbi:MAG: ribonuclease Z, partial [Treponema sp.]|nr:ribonuclease Z [Candidatus Treponema scatequi]